jgi:hypothetical protein
VDGSCVGIGFGKHQHEDRRVLVDSDSPNLPARFAVSHVCVRITEPVALGGERGSVVSKKVFESRFFTAPTSMTARPCRVDRMTSPSSARRSNVVKSRLALVIEVFMLEK